MINAPQIFHFDSKEVRTLTADNGEPWFVAQDVAEVLGYSNTRDAVSRHCKAAKAGVAFHDGSQNRVMTIIPERDVYRLVMRSKMPSAEKFEEWVVGEVLPSLRKSGAYEIQTPEMQIAHALVLATKMIEQKDAMIAEMAPKAEFFDTVTDSQDAVDIGTVAKVLNCGIGRTRLFEFLRSEKILMGNNAPMQKYIDCGYFRVIESSWTKPDGSSHVNMKTVVYQKGVDFIRKRIKDKRQRS
jgi:anti-repressor protein